MGQVGSVAAGESTSVTQQEERQRSRARGIVAVAIRKGTLVRQPCAECGKANADAHHRDYSKPLEVEWLCELHHMSRHRRYYPRVKRTQKQLGFVTMRMTADTRKDIKEVSKRTGVKLWFALEKAAADLLRQVKANGK